MKPNYKPPFETFVKKQHKVLRLLIEDTVEDICENPDIGEPKKGDLQGIYVYKFSHNRQEYLIAYRPPSTENLNDGQIEILIIDFLKVGSHENFYSNLKKYLKS